MSATRPRVWVSQPLFEDIVDGLRAHVDVVATPTVRKHAATDVAAALRDVDGALVTLNDAIGIDAIRGATRLRVVANVGVGYDNLDIAALAQAGIVATNTPDVLTETTADFGFALMMAAARRITEAERFLREGQWQGWQFGALLGNDIHGSTLGILGMGRIGQAIARRARGFGMRVLYHNRSRLDPAVEASLPAQWVERATLFTEADHLLLVLPYAPANHHLVDAGLLASMKPSATLTSIARGGLIDEGALAEALATGRLAAAALDVFEGEPRVDPRLLALRNVVLTPHIASGSLATRRAMVALAVDNLLAVLGLGAHAHRPPSPIAVSPANPR